MLEKLSAPVRQYVEARASLHHQIQNDQLLGTAAIQSGDQITLSSNVQVGEKTFAKGSSYSLDPYSNRDASREDLTYQEGTKKVHIHHEFDPGFFSTTESLKIDNQAGFDVSNSDQSTSSGGVRPDGWLQKQVGSIEGFILNI